MSVPGTPTGGAEGATTELLEVAVKAARTGGALLLGRYRQGEQEGVRSKSTPTDLVSDADLDSQRLIRTLLGRLRPQDGFVGEEDVGEAEPGTGASGGEGTGGWDADLDGPRRDGGERAGGGLRWVVDPLDGTVNFLFAIPQWCVSVAVQDAGGGTLAGAIFDPCREELWTAARGGEAMMNGTAVRGSERGELATAMVATGFYYDAAVRAEQGATMARLLPLVRDIRRFGSAALDLVWTAAGRYDAYFERGVKLWDVAAGALICERAGLEVVDLPARGALPSGLLVAPAGLVEALVEIVG